MDKGRVLELARQLTAAPGVSGREDCAAFVAADLLDNLAELIPSPLGNILAIVNEGKPGAPHLMLTAHLDQIGMLVTHVEKDGFLRIAQSGGFDRRLLPATPLVIHAKSGRYPAVIASTPPHLIDAADGEKPKKITELAVDTGFSGARAAELFAPGDPVTMENAFVQMSGDLLLSAAQDNRIGCAAVLAAAEMIARQKPDCRVSIALVVMEETTGAGASTATAQLRPDMAVVVDVSFADGFGVPEYRCGRIGQGPMLATAPVLDNRLTDALRRTAEQSGIPLPDEVMGGVTCTDSEAVAAAAGGVRTALLSIPLRNMHTGVEVTCAEDTWNTARLLAQFAGEVKQNGAL